MASALLLIVLLPALGAFVNGARSFANPLTPKNRTITNFFALATTGLSALIASWVVFTYTRGNTHEPFVHAYYTWIPSGLGHAGKAIADFGVDFAFRIDPLS